MKFQPWEQITPQEWERKSESGMVVAKVIRGAERSEDEPPWWRWSVGAIREWVGSEEDAKAAADKELHRFFDIPQPEFDEQWALNLAITAARLSPCKKSQHGVVIWHPGFPDYARGWNHQPNPHTYDGSDHCRTNCGKLCVHAEAHALLRFPEVTKALPPGQSWMMGAHMLHVKTVAGEPVASGGPSCWQCSRLILQSGISTMWLLHDEGLRAYTAEKFH